MLLRLIFNPSITISVLHNSSTQDSPNIDDEDNIDGNLQYGRVHMDVDGEIPYGPLRLNIMGGVTTYFRNWTIDSQLNHKGKKKTRLSQMGDAVKAWGETFRLEIRYLKLELRYYWLKLRDIRMELVIKL